MIEVQKYLDKLDRLKEYMGLVIDGKIQGRIWFNALAFPDLPIKELIRLYNETGMMFCNSEEPTIFKQFTFDEWLETLTHKADKA
jgi:predicted transcriptional regulator